MKTTRGKVPAGPKAQPGKAGKKASSRKLAKPVGTDPSKPSYGILHGGNQSGDKLRAKANSMFGNGGRNTPTGQEQLTKKVKRQAY
jgi:poly(3-hydroxybutyrate) depolymerase